jgi:hypothetical protein
MKDVTVDGHSSTDISQKMVTLYQKNVLHILPKPKEINAENIANASQ